MKTNTVILSVVGSVLFLLSPVFAFNTTVGEKLDFASWDHQTIVGAGQNFENVCGDVDVMVTAMGDFDLAPSAFVSTQTGQTSSLQTQLMPGSSQTYSFSFSEPIPLVLDLDLLDQFETVEVTTSGSASYSHLSGSLPSRIATVGGLTLQGTAVGSGPNGAARGSIDLGMSDQFTLKYSSSAATSFTKYGAFALGKSAGVVPEPGSCGLLFFGLLGLIGIRRNRR